MDSKEKKAQLWQSIKGKLNQEEWEDLVSLKKSADLFLENWNIHRRRNAAMIKVWQEYLQQPKDELGSFMLECLTPEQILHYELRDEDIMTEHIIGDIIRVAKLSKQAPATA